MIYSLVTAMKPRMLVTFDKDFNPLPVSVRVGQVCTSLCCCIIVTECLTSDIFSMLLCGDSDCIIVFNIDLAP